MRHLRAAIRIVIIIFGTGLLYLIWILSLAVCFASSRGRIHVRRFIVRNWSRFMSVVLGMRLKVVGIPPDPPFCLVANHLSYVDALALSTSVNGVFVSRADVRHWPVLGHLAWLSGTVFINRSVIRDIVRVNQQIAEALERGMGVIFFPEGTSTRGVNVGPFRSPLLALSADTGLPVHYASITYETEPPDPPASLCICYWGEMTFIGHLYNLLTIRGFRALIHFGEQPITRNDRKELASALKKEIEKTFEPVAQEDDP